MENNKSIYKWYSKEFAIILKNISKTRLKGGRVSLTIKDTRFSADLDNIYFINAVLKNGKWNILKIEGLPEPKSNKLSDKDFCLVVEKLFKKAA